VVAGVVDPAPSPTARIFVSRAQDDGVDGYWTGGGLSITLTKFDALRANLRLVGELDLASADVLSTAMDDQLAAGRRYVRLDISRLEFLDTAGVAVLTDVHSAFRQVRGTVILTGATPRTRRLLRLVAVDQVLLVAAEHAEAGPALVS
jgi:anti-sigma B factor antagonist